LRPSANTRHRGILLAPVALDHSGVSWGRAKVYISPLLIRYEAADGSQAETVVQPKNIQGPLTTGGKVRPDMLFAYCESRKGLFSFQLTEIVWAADLKTGDLIEDLFHYLGNAQPGGAPALEYTC
jgi:hypothetical protein